MDTSRRREAVVEEEEAGATLAAVVRGITELSWSKSRSLIANGRVALDGTTCFDAAMRVGGGEHVEITPHGRKHTAPELEDERIVFVDHHLLVVDKPAGLVTVPRSDREPDSLVTRCESWLARQGDARQSSRARLQVVQRLDVDTSGVMVFARTRQAKKAIEDQLRKHSVERIYEAIAAGVVEPARHESWLVPNRGDGRRGSFRGAGRPPREGRKAITHVEFEEALNDATRIACRLETGRQHQIRIHLAEAEHALLGDRMYAPAKVAARARRPMLHARSLGVQHPDRGVTMRWHRPPPADFAALVADLRR